MFHALGVALALYSGARLNLPALLVDQLAITAIQLMTHYSNDYFDLEADRANLTPSNWSGGSRVLPDNLLSPQVAHTAALVLLGVAIVAAFLLAFVVQTGPLTLPLLGLAILLAWFYSAPPIHLHSRGLGELTTALLVPGLTPLVGFYLQSGRLDALWLLAVFPPMCLQFAMLLSIEFPDEAGDRQTGKRTLVVRLGAERAAQLYVAVLLAAYLSLPVLVALGLPPLVAFGEGLLAPLAAWQVWCVRRKDYADPRQWNTFAFFSVGLLIATGLVEVIAFLLLVGFR